MPIDPGTAAGIGAGAGLAGDLVNSAGALFSQMQGQRFSKRMYERQFADNIAFWNMQNEYNSPQAQMQRFQAAGLNPNLIYGQGNAGNASPIQTPDVQPVQFRNPEFGNALKSAGLGFMNAIYDLDIKQAQIDNLKAQNTVYLEDALLKAAQRKGTMTNEERTRFNLDLESELRPISADTRREQLRQLRTTTDIAIERNAREAALNASSIQEAAERMLTMREQRTVIPYQKRQMDAETARARETIRQMEKDGTLKDMDIELRKQGINPQDPMWARIVGRILSDLFDPQSSQGGGTSIRKSFWDFLFSR